MSQSFPCASGNMSGKREIWEGAIRLQMVGLTEKFVSDFTKQVIFKQGLEFGK